MFGLKIADTLDNQSDWSLAPIEQPTSEVSSSPMFRMTKLTAVPYFTAHQKLTEKLTDQKNEPG